MSRHTRASGAATGFVSRHFAVALVCGLLVAASALVASAADDAFRAAAVHYREQRWQEACDAFAELLSADSPHTRAAEARFFYGEALLQLDRWQEARGQFSQLVASDPAGPHARQALFRAGEAAYMIGDDRAAQHDLQAFHEQYPDDPLGAYVLPYLGSLALQAGDATAAQQLFAQAVERFGDGPLAAESNFGWAQALHQSGQLDQARERYRAVIDQGHPLAEQALLQLATLENAEGHFQAALEALDQFDAGFPASPLTDKGRLGRGYALHKLDRQAEAQAVLQAVADDATLGPEAAYWLALAHKAQDHWAAAAETLSGIRVDKQHPLAAAIGFHAADAQLRDGKLDAAHEQFEQVLAEFPRSAWADDAQLGKLRVAAERQQHAELVRLADELIDRFPNSPLVAQARLGKGQALAALDKPADAIAALEPLLEAKSAPDGPDAEIATRARSALAVCHAKLGHFDQSRKLLAVLADDPAAAELTTATTYQVAELAFAAGEAELAQQLFASVAGSDGSDRIASRAQSGLGWSHFRAQRWAEAADAFGRLLETDPDGPLAAEAALLRGRAQEHLEQFDEAQAMYRTVIERYSNSPRVAEALWLSARLHEQREQPADAKVRYARLVDGHPDFAERDAALFRYALLVAPDDAAQAEKLLLRLKTEFPDSRFAPDATLRLAERALDEQRFDDAERWLVDVTEPNTPDTVRRQALYLAGRMEIARGRWSEVIAPLDRLINEFPAGEPAQQAAYLIAEAHFRQQHYEQAVGRLAALAAQTPGRTDAWLAMAELRRAQSLAHLRNWAEALAIARGISARFADFEQQYEVDYLIGRSLAAQADFAAARQSYAKVIDSPRPGAAEVQAMAQWMIGESYFHQENYATALAEYLKVDGAYPRWHAAALLQAGKCAEALGRWSKAAENYARLLELYPGGDLSDEAQRRLGDARQRAAGPSAARK